MKVLPHFERSARLVERISARKADLEEKNSLFGQKLLTGQEHQGANF